MSTARKLTTRASDRLAGCRLHVAAADAPVAVALALEPVGGEPERTVGVAEVDALNEHAPDPLRHQEGDAGRAVDGRVAGTHHGDESLRSAEHRPDRRSRV